MTVRMFPGHCPLSGVEIMSAAIWKLVLSPFASKMN